MKILFISSEAVPYIKTGGLGDVAGVLPKLLAEAGHQVKLVLPFYLEIKHSHKYPFESVLSPLVVNMGDSNLYCQVIRHQVSKNLEVYFVEYDEYYYRTPIYDDGKNAYADNGARYAFLSKAALDLAQALDFQPDVVHANDWQTALVPYYMKTWGWKDDFYKDSASILSLHNMGYQGQVPLSLANFIGLTSQQVRPDEFEALGALNLLKGGIFYADKISTVSPTYALEILSEPGGSGLASYLERRKEDIVGILNGIDEEEWNPETDEWIPANFSAKDLKGKAKCKERLQKHFMLDVDPKLPIFGMVGRMASQKGLDLLKDRVHQILQWDLQLVVLGSGDPELTSFFGDLPKYYPGQVGAFIGFQPYLAHLIEAGSDFFLMPSRYEPCGLNQMYSLKYGTLPLVRAVGGLKDTVAQFDEKTGAGTGFLFEDATPQALQDTIGWALHAWYQEPAKLKKMQVRAMQQDVSWGPALKAYEALYQSAIDRRESWK